MNFINYLHTLTVISVGLVIEHVGQVNSVPVIRNERWRQPCRGSGGPSSQPLLSRLRGRVEPDNTVAFRLWIKATDVLNDANNIAESYATDRIQSTRLKTALEVQPPLPGFPSSRALSSSLSLMERMRKDYLRASLAAVFLEQMTSDERSPLYNVRYSKLENKIHVFLCQLEDAITDRTSQSIEHVSRSAMRKIDRVVSDMAERETRDYRILIGIIRVFQGIESDYDLLRIQVINNMTG